MKRNSGLTLIEIIIAMVLFGVVSLGSMAFFSLGKNQAVKAKRMNFALGLAEDQVEVIKTMDYSAITTGSRPVQRYDTTFTQFYAASEVTTFDEIYKIVQVKVSWPVAGVIKDIELITTVSED